MNPRPNLNVPPPPQAPWIPRRGSPTHTPLDLLVALAVAAFMAAALFLCL
jgi:hypothetical protein